MHLLCSDGESYGLELVEKSGGQLKRGTVYVTLSRMEDKGYLESWKEAAGEGQQGPPRRLYKATGYGAQVFKLWKQLREAKRSWFADLSLGGQAALGGIG